MLSIVILDNAQAAFKIHFRYVLSLFSYLVKGPNSAYTYIHDTE